MTEIKVTLEDGRNVVVYANSYEQAIGVAEQEFGMPAHNPRDVVPEITEYMSDGADVLAQYDDGHQEIIITARNAEHAALTVKALNAAI